MIDMDQTGLSARNAAKILSHCGTAQKKDALFRIATGLRLHQAKLIERNQVDIEQARSQGLTDALIDRLTLTAGRIAGMAADVEAIAEMPDPVGERLERRGLPNGLEIEKRRVPLGVLGVIYESRPNVTIDVSALSIYTGNAAILRGGKETMHTNLALMQIVQDALEGAGLPKDTIQLIGDPDRQYIFALLQMIDYIDLIIPRGGAGLHDFCRKNSRIPVITGGIGVCHLYWENSALTDESVEVVYNAKVQRPSVCNALDTLLVERSAAEQVIPRVIGRLREAGVKFRLTEEAMRFVSGRQTDDIQLAGPDDFDTEWLSLVLGIKVVSGLDEAIGHIQQHSTGHSDGILTEDAAQAAEFLNSIDSAAVYWNASTRFTDGAQLGLGAEVAVSTQRVHARGPMGLPELTSYKWVVSGRYHTRAG